MDGLVGVVLEKCPAAVPCATVDEESGSNLKLESCVDQPDVLLSARQLLLKTPFFQINPCIKISFPQNKP